MAKVVKVASSRWNEVRTYETDAITWGELKGELGDQILNFEGSTMKAVLRGEDGTRNTLVDNNTLLPQGDFAILLVPEKVKSGSKIVYNSAVFKDMKTKLNKMLDFLIEATEKGGEMVFEETNSNEEWDIDLEDDLEDEIDSLILEARELAGE
jgi:hypothetical protein